MTKILLLEDDISLIDGLEYSLQKNGFDVETVRTVKEAFARLHTADSLYDIDYISQFSLLLLDVSLPDGTGFEVCEKVRKQNSHIPIIFLTASDEEVNIIRGLDIGGDDYITKPFKTGELCSRIRALLRRTDPAGSKIFSSGLSIDFMTGRVTSSGQALELTKTEFHLLSLLVRNAGQTVTRDMILNELWDNTGDFVDDNTVSVYVRRLREKLEADPSRPVHLLTVRGFGYKWEENV